MSIQRLIALSASSSLSLPTGATINAFASDRYFVGVPMRTNHWNRDVFQHPNLTCATLRARRVFRFEKPLSQLEQPLVARGIAV